MSFWSKGPLVPSRDNAYRPHLLRRGPLLCLLGLALLTEALLVGNLLLRPGHDFLAAVVQSEILTLTNTERVDNHVGMLTESELLDKSAQAKADDMAAKGYFAHVSPDGKQPWDFITNAGYDYHYAGENLAVRFVDSKDVVDAWMASPSHKANIVKGAYREIGVGVAQGTYKGEPATFVVEHFASPSGVVLGAQVAQLNNSIVRQVGRLFAEPRTTTAWVLGGIAVLLLVALAFAFFHHIQIQAYDLLVPGGVVAAVVLVLLVLNANALSAPATQTASVAGSVDTSAAVVINAAAASTLR